MSDNSSNFRVPAGAHVHSHPDVWPIADSTMHYLSRPPMWEPPALPIYPQLMFAGSPPADALSSAALAPEALLAPPAGRTPERAELPVKAVQAERNPASASALEVRRHVETLLRLTLEVVDRRRRPEQLKTMATQPVIDALVALSVSSPPGRELGTATLRKIRIVSAGDRAAEICASYTRGPRVFAIAGRIERRRKLWVATTLLLA